MQPAKTSRILIPPHSWSELPWGEFYRESLQQQLDVWWPKMFGFYLLKLGHLSAELATDKCLVQRHICLAQEGEDLQVYADVHQLPFQNRSIDACILSHVLGYSSNPHLVLREVDRVLMDDGWLILSDFNPLSLIGVGGCVPLINRTAPYNSRLFSLVRLLDWLSLLNFEILEQKRVQLLPWSRAGQRFWDKHLPVLGCVNLVIARKRTVPMTLNPLGLKKSQPKWGQVVGTARIYKDKL